MGEPPDEPSLSNRFRSWAKHHARNGRASSKQAPILPNPEQCQISLRDGQLVPSHSTTTTCQGANSIINIGHGINTNVNIVPDDSPAASPPPAPPPQDTEAHGEKPPTVEQNAQTQKPNIPTCVKNGMQRFVIHTKEAIFHSWINVLLIFVPIGIAVNFAGLNPEIIFAMNAIAIVPLAGLLTHATESVASRLGDTLGALLNVSFGNAVELIIFIALVKNEIRIVQASLLGSILANLLLILGMAFLFGGLRFQEQIYNNTVTQMSACLLSLSVMSLLLPTAFHASFNDTATADSSTIKISRGTSVVLLLVYLIYLLFQLKSHAYLYESMPQERIDEESHPGLLHDLMDSSSSSSSSTDSDDSDTDTTSGSVTTAKRIRRAFKHRKRRKSSISSKDTPSLPSHLSSPANEINLSYLDETHGQHRTSTLGPILSGDEADTDGEKGHTYGQTRIRDFQDGNGDSSRSPERLRSPSSRVGRKRKHRRSHRKAKNAEKLEELSEKPSTSNNQDQVKDHLSPRVEFAQNAELPSGSPEFNKVPSKMRHLTSRPTLPKLLSQNVFLNQPQSNTPAGPSGMQKVTIPSLRRTSSLPDRLNRQPPAPAGTSRVLPPYVARPPTAPSPTAANNGEEEQPQMSRTAAVVMLLVSTGLVALCAEFLVNAIPNMTSQSSVSQSFIGLIILPIVGNAAEHVTAVTVATKNKMDLAIGVAVGSSIQIALFVTPLVVILGWIMNKAMTLYFTLFETISLFVTAFVVNFLVLDGKSNYLEGTLLISAYVIIAVAAFFYPDLPSQSELGGSDNHLRYS